MRIDTHHHLLPGVDDGCRDLADVISNARADWLGVHGGRSARRTLAILLPGSMDLTVEQVCGDGVAELRVLLQSANVPLENSGRAGRLRLDPHLSETLTQLRRADIWA